MANNEILQIVVFSMFFGIAGASLGEIQRAAGRRAQRRLSYHAEGHRICDVRGSAGYFCRHLIGYRLAGDGHLLNYASFIGGYYIAVLTSAVLLAVGYMVLKKRSSACSTCSKIRCWWRSTSSSDKRIRRPWSGWSVWLLAQHRLLRAAHWLLL
jgi:Na+/H+-dicarboxylate symporter